MTDCSDAIPMDAFLSRWCYYRAWFGMGIRNVGFIRIHAGIEIEHSGAVGCHGYFLYIPQDSYVELARQEAETSHTRVVVCINDKHPSQ